MMASKGHFCMTYKHCASGDNNCHILSKKHNSSNTHIAHQQCHGAIPAASNRHRDHTFTQIPQPIQSSSEIHAVFEFSVTSMQSLPAQHQKENNGSDRHGFWSKLLRSVV